MTNKEEIWKILLKYLVLRNAIARAFYVAAINELAFDATEANSFVNFASETKTAICVNAALQKDIGFRRWFSGVHFQCGFKNFSFGNRKQINRKLELSTDLPQGNIYIFQNVIHKKFCGDAIFSLRDSRSDSNLIVPVQRTSVQRSGRKSPGSIRALKDGSLTQL